MSGYEPKSAAKTLLAEARDMDLQITNLKLQKLLYLAHGLSLARTDAALINEPFQAWKYGPVVESLYHQLKVFGPDRINVNDPFVKTWASLPAEADQHCDSIRDVLRQFGTWTGGQLVELSHEKDGPWDQAYNSASSSILIDDDKIKKYFKDRLAPA